jgi:hypothetical protein
MTLNPAGLISEPVNGCGWGIFIRIAERILLYFQSKTDAESAIRRLVVVDGEIEVEKKIGRATAWSNYLEAPSSLCHRENAPTRDYYHLTQDCTPFNPSHRDTCTSTCAFRYAMSKVFCF